MGCKFENIDIVLEIEKMQNTHFWVPVRPIPALKASFYGASDSYTCTLDAEHGTLDGFTCNRSLKVDQLGPRKPWVYHYRPRCSTVRDTTRIAISMCGRPTVFEGQVDQLPRTGCK